MRLYEHDTYLNTNIFYLFNTEIVEYDLKEAGFNIIKEYNLLPEMIKSLSEMDKEKRKIQIGNYQRDNEDLKEKLKLGFIDARKTFFKTNDIDDNDVISIKKDAIFIHKRNKSIKEKVGKYLDFRVKNNYSSYIRLNSRVELYYNSEKLDIKGINEMRPYHEDYMIKFINKYFYHMENSTPVEVIEFTKRFIDKYKKGKLENGYYREFNSVSKYKFLTDDIPLAVNPNELMLWNIDRKFNLDILIKLIKIAL
jgi:hypothetical protein